MKNLLIVEDNYKLASSIKEFLGNKSYNTNIEIDGLLGYQKAMKPSYDLIILDINLPRKNGFDILASLRVNNIDVPILMLTKKSDTDDIVVGLNNGADDYISKPFNLFELKARIDKLLIRPPRFISKILTLHDLSLDLTNRTMSRQDKDVPLKKTEFATLKLLLQHQGQVLTREQIFNNVWAFNTKRTKGLIDVYIKHLRDKVDKGFDTKLIKTVHGLGYIMHS